MKNLLLTLIASVGLCAIPSLANAQAGTTAGATSTVALVVVGLVVLGSAFADDDAPAAAYSGACVGWTCTNTLPVEEEEEEVARATTTATTATTASTAASTTTTTTT